MLNLHLSPLTLRVEKDIWRLVFTSSWKSRTTRKFEAQTHQLTKLIFMPVFALVTRSKEKNTECEFRSLQVSLLSYGTTLIASAASLQSWSNLAIICITSLKSLGQNVKNECRANLQVSVGQWEPRKVLKEGSTFDLSPRRDGGSKTIVLLFKSCFFKT